MMTNGHASTNGEQKIRGTAPAFPMFSPSPAEPGLSRRAYVATRALQGLLAGDPEIEHRAAAVEAVAYADELLRALGEA